MNSPARPNDESCPLVLQCENALLSVEPASGGAIREYRWKGYNLLRPTPQGRVKDPFDFACFPLAPYANRIARGRFEFGGRSIHLEPNWRGSLHPLHGQGWIAPWAVCDSSATNVEMEFVGEGNEWPWRYRARQGILLSADMLSIRLSRENLSETPMPAMLGLHPYFPHRASARLGALLPRVWLTDQEVLPVREVTTPAEWSFDPMRPVHTVVLDHCFTGWNGAAEIHGPGYSLHLHAPDCNSLHIYSPPPRGDFFCVEPQTAPAGALNRGVAEPNVVLPGETFSMKTTIIAREGECT